jgi:hypothetical protein
MLARSDRTPSSPFGWRPHPCSLVPILAVNQGKKHAISDFIFRTALCVYPLLHRERAVA